MDAEKLNLSRASALLAVAPTAEEAELIRGYDGDVLHARAFNPQPSSLVVLLTRAACGAFSPLLPCSLSSSHPLCPLVHCPLLPCSLSSSHPLCPLVHCSLLLCSLVQRSSPRAGRSRSSAQPRGTLLSSSRSRALPHVCARGSSSSASYAPTHERTPQHTTAHHAHPTAPIVHDPPCAHHVAHLSYPLHRSALLPAHADPVRVAVCVGPLSGAAGQ
jgi:hypothetical protein